MSRYDISDYLTRRRYSEQQAASWRASNKACDDPVITAETIWRLPEPKAAEDAPSIFRSMPLGSTLER
jgi:hypothetical protein